MKARTIHEIGASVNEALNINDAVGLQSCVDEMLGMDSVDARALLLSTRGAICRLNGEFTAALELYNKALELYREIGQKASIASAMGSIGIVLWGIGRYTEALEYLNTTLVMHTELGNRMGMARVSGNIGIVHYNIADYAGALEWYGKALALHNKLNEPNGQNETKGQNNSNDANGVASVTGNIGNVHWKTGNYPTALEHFNRAFAIHEAEGDRRGMGVILNSIGNVHLNLGNHAAALETFERALAIREELGSKHGVAVVLVNIGNVHAQTGNLKTAVEYYNRSLQLRIDLGDHRGVSLVRANLLEAHLLSGDIVSAENLLCEMDSTQIDEPDTLIDRERHRATIQTHYSNYSDAKETLTEALKIALELNLAEKQVDLYKQLRDLALLQNDLASYVEFNNAFTTLNDEINGKEASLNVAMQEKQREIDAREKEHQKYMAVLHSTLPKHIADRVARGEVVTDHFDNAGVLFLDVVGFTHNSALLEAGEVVELLQKIFLTFDSICAKHNITKIKTIGDAYMAVAFPVAENGAGSFSPGINLPDNFSGTISPGHFSHHVNLASASIEIINSKFTWSHNSLPVEFRIGLHSGPVVAGVLGTERMQYDVWGDTVNVASRMESTGEPGRIHVSEAFANQLRSGDTSSHPLGDTIVDSIKIWRRGEIEVKGKGMMQTFWLEGTIIDSLADNGDK